MQSKRLSEALEQLRLAIGKVEKIVSEMQAERDPLAAHIFNARRGYRRIGRDTKSGARHETAALVSFKQATELGFPGTLSDWRRLLAASSERTSKSNGGS